MVYILHISFNSIIAFGKVHHWNVSVRASSLKRKKKAHRMSAFLIALFLVY